MRRTIPAVRILPMSDQAEGFRGRGIEDVQREAVVVAGRRGRADVPTLFLQVGKSGRRRG